MLRGNLAPEGAVIKQSASSPHLLKHRGQALVFDSPEDYYAVSNDPDLDVDENTVLVIRYCGPRGYPGMPEVSNVALPKKLLVRGITRHGADLRRPDVGHRLRHGRAARLARGRRGRPAGPGADRRLDHAWTCRPAR